MGARARDRVFVVVRCVERELDGRGLAWRLGLLVAAQFWISSEIAFTATLALAVGLGLAYWLVCGVRGRLRSSVPPIAAGDVLGAVRRPDRLDRERRPRPLGDGHRLVGLAW